MNLRTIIVHALLRAAAFGSLMDAAQADTLSNIKLAKKLRVGIDLGLPPYGTMDDKMRATGSDVGTAHLLADDLGVELEIVPSTGANRIPFLLTHKIDVVISSLSITPEREKVIAFSLPYGIIQVGVAAPAAMTIENLADLVGKTVAVSRGTAADQDATKAAKGINELMIARYEDDATLITAITTGQQDFVVTAPAQLREINQKAPEKRMMMKLILRQNGYAIGLRKGETALKARLDEFVKANLANGKLGAIYKTYHGTELPAKMPD
jgi:polar amino acid transport system substrate-binding protein